LRVGGVVVELLIFGLVKVADVDDEAEDEEKARTENCVVVVLLLRKTKSEEASFSC